ncbi:hypothetical protein OH491_19405 [Termitidicoccus mucosus]|uniref:NifB/NifX family molybdenum-iron cluster-binding protein n=1 Tax=Termitidicoccus mucosus TaxID=1184151 RepID=UPI000A02CB81
MNIAIPLTDNSVFSLHYGGSIKVGLYEVDPQKRLILSSSEIIPPLAEPCEWGTWLCTQEVRVLLAGGIGSGAQACMAESGIQVIAGLPAAEPRELVQAWLDGRLVAGPNACKEHDGHHEHDEHHQGHSHGNAHHHCCH